MRRIRIRIRIALIAGLAAALTALATGSFALSRSYAAIEADFDTSLGEESAEAYIAVQGGLALDSFRHPGSIYGVQRVGVFDSSGNLLDSTEPNPPPLPGGRPAGVYFTVMDLDRGEELRVINTEVVSNGEMETLVVAIPTMALTERNAALFRTVGWLGFVFVALAVVGAHLIAGFALAPIERLRRSAVELADRPGDGRLVVPAARDEVSRLAETLNLGLDRVERTMENQRRFLAEASHELRTPIARLRADIDLARRPIRTPDEVASALERIDDHADHLTSLADSLLGMLSPRVAPRDFPHATGVDEILGAVLDRAPGGDGVLIEASDEARQSHVVTEPFLLIGVVSNLIENAFRHGVPPVTLTVSRNDDRIEFAVRDHGRGIPAEYHGAVLEPFGRGPAVTSGIGLGLSVVSNFALTEGGELVIEDAGPGCRMVLRVPAEPASV